jgi:penicillin-binding protein 1A
MPKNDTSSTHSSDAPVLTGRTALIWAGRLVVGLAGLAVAGVACVMMAVGIALAVAYPNLPEVAGLADYRPKLPLRVISSEGDLIGEFGEERRNLLTINEIPPLCG